MKWRSDWLVSRPLRWLLPARAPRWFWKIGLGRYYWSEEEVAAAKKRAEELAKEFGIKEKP